MAVADKLCNASACGNLSEVLSLLENGADVNGLNSFNRTPLQVVMLGSSAVIQELLLKGANPNVRDPVRSLTVLHDAAREGFVDSVRVLVDFGADANLVDEQGNLPLHLAAREGHVGAVRLLIARTVNPETPNGLGYTARQLALDHQRTETVNSIDEYLTAH